VVDPPAQKVVPPVTDTERAAGTALITTGITFEILYVNPDAEIICTE
jgi:hypothetical protein